MANRIKALVVAFLLVFSLAPAATADDLAPGPDDGLSVEEYERRVTAWCDGLVSNYGWVRDRDGSVTGWAGGCWRPDDRERSHAECLAAGYEWDCPLPDPYPEPVPSDPYTPRNAEPVAAPEPNIEEDPEVSIDNTFESSHPLTSEGPSGSFSVFPN